MAALMPASGVRRSCETADSSAVRAELSRASAAASPAALLQGAPLEDRAGVRGEGGEEPLPVGRHRRADEHEVVLVVGRGVGLVAIAGCRRPSRAPAVGRRRLALGDDLGRRVGAWRRRTTRARRAPNMSTACSSSTVIWSVEPSRVWVSSASAADSRWAATARSARRALVCTTNATTTATTTKTTRAMAFSGSEIVRVRTGSGEEPVEQHRGRHGPDEGRSDAAEQGDEHRDEQVERHGQGQAGVLGQQRPAGR